ncbi:MAG: hypothetical protein ACFB3T_03165, partial [Geminicoccaceae bacterium]
FVPPSSTLIGHAQAWQVRREVRDRAVRCIASTAAIGIADRRGLPPGQLLIERSALADSVLVVLRQPSLSDLEAYAVVGAEAIPLSQVGRALHVRAPAGRDAIIASLYAGNDLSLVLEGETYGAWREGFSAAGFREIYQRLYDQRCPQPPEARAALAAAIAAAKAQEAAAEAERAAAQAAQGKPGTPEPDTRESNDDGPRILDETSQSGKTNAQQS